MTKSLVPFVPFELVYFETFNTRIEAIEREKYFKSAAGRRFLKKKIENGPVVQCLPDCGIQVGPPDYVIQAGPPVPNEILEWLVVFNMMLIS